MQQVGMGCQWTYTGGMPVLARVYKKPCRLHFVTTGVMCLVQAVLQDNLHLLKASHLLDPTYFSFIMAMVKASSEMYSHKYRRTGTRRLLLAGLPKMQCLHSPSDVSTQHVLLPKTVML